MMDQSLEFQNIDLDVSQELGEENQQIYHVEEAEPLAEVSNDHQTADDVVIEQRNEYLDQLTRQLMEDYSRYFQLKPTAQIDELNESIDNLLTHMEEFYGLIEMIRSESNYCLDQYTMVLMPKMKQIRSVYAMIDKLERIVNHVSFQVSLMEGEVSRAEKIMGANAGSVATSAIKKFFSFIGGSSSSSSQSDHSVQSKYKYVPPDIFKTEDLFKL